MPTMTPTYSQLPTLLLCRPHADSVFFKKEIERQLGEPVHAVISPAYLIEPIDFETPDETPDFLIFTSRNGVKRAAASQLRSKFGALCVGDATAREATDAGYKAISAAGDVNDLAQLALEQTPNTTFFHVSGAHVAGDLERKLDSINHRYTRVLAYRQVPQRPTLAFKSAIMGSGPVVLPLFSARSALILEGIDLNASVKIVAMSKNVTSALGGETIKNAAYAPTKDLEGMITATINQMRL